ncbi:G-type lectin S-receptor-like serine/threonine-protein kinase At1g11300 isoform X2 [Primulina huaijiensis]|uniref:G-type lectin S-receptor-like serine/threonine-protein kinase At1g11300 isoform X2 n=1 Tax=Primulina huaijiensis TaxID=1492673 RepID=UPI003CC6F728
MGFELEAVFFLLISSCFFFKFSSAIDTISANQSIRDPETLVSSGQKFKLGFFSPVNSSYRYVGILYNIPVMTVIWVANRENPLYDANGTLLISEDGNLVISDGKKQIIWSSNVSNSILNSSAQLLDTGNLVLLDNSNGKIVWESFLHASNSFIANMKIFTDLTTQKKNILTSWRSPSDPAPGRFTLTIEPLEIPQCFVWQDSFTYWRGGPWDGQVFIGIYGNASFNQRGLKVEDANPRAPYETFASLDSSILYYELDATGNLSEKIWDNKTRAWMVTWASILTECDVYAKCGPFGSCNAREAPICSCLPGFEPKNGREWNAGNWTSGCLRRAPLECGKNSSVGEMGKIDGFLRLESMKVPDRLNWVPSFEPECRSRCLNNCSCLAYAYRAGIGCMLWAESLIDVQKFPSGGTDLYIRLADSELGNNNKKDHKAIIAAVVVIVSIIVPFCAYFLWKYRGRKKKANHGAERDPPDPWFLKETRLKDNVHGVKLEELPLFKFTTLANATDSFDINNKLGQGGFGPVYKGMLANGQEIAVKRLARSSCQGVKELMNEVMVISKLQHRNLVRLLGCCVECEENMLVYEYMPNGSLDAYLFDSHKQGFLDWRKRVIIIEGICRGLLYLHRDSRLKIIHRDLKASNILLDEELNPKISDFGMARIFGEKEDQASTTRVVGTYGYMAPEYAVRGRLSEKSDVFSFGVLLLEIISGRRNASFENDEQSPSLIGYAWKLWNEEKIVNLVDPLVNDSSLMEKEIARYANVGLLCVEETAKDRPNISTILSMLSNEIAELPHPRQPAFTLSQETEQTSIKCSSNDITLTMIQGR